MPEIKYEASMTEYQAYILAAARTIYNQDKEVRAFINDSTPTCLRGCLRKNHGDSYHGTSNEETQFDCSPKGIRIQADENYIVLSWSQMTKFMQDNASKISDEKSSDFPCDNCGYDNKGCCDYPDSQEDYCVMGDKQIPVPFDYSSVDDNTANILRECEETIRKESSGYFTLLGRKFKEAQELLASHGKGTFEQWYTSLGFKRQTVYNLIQRYDFICSPTIGGHEETFEALPLTLSYEVSKPDAPTELVEKVLDGDIVSNAEYKKLKAELEDANKKVELAQFHEKKSHEAFDRVADASKVNFEKYQTERRKNEELEKRIRELESRPIDVAVQTDESAIAQKDEEIAELKEEIEILKDNSHKRFIIMLTMEEYDELMKITETSPKINSAIKSAKILRI